MTIVNKIRARLKTPSQSQIIMTRDVISLMSVINVLSNALKLMHDNAWSYEEGYDESSMCERNIKALKAADVIEYCGKWEEGDYDGSKGIAKNKEKPENVT